MSGSNEDCRPPVAGRGDGRRRLGAVTGYVCRYALAAVFLMAAVTKVTDLRAFEDQMLLRSHLPAWLAQATARFLPWLELTCGACLALGYAVREAALLAGLLLAAFLLHGLTRPAAEADCGCFLFPRLRPAEQTWWQPARNLLLLLCSVRVARGE